MEMKGSISPGGDGVYCHHRDKGVYLTLEVTGSIVTMEVKGSISPGGEGVNCHHGDEGVYLTWR